MSQSKLGLLIGIKKWIVEPLILLNVVVFTSIQLHLLIGIIASKSINYAIIMQGSEEGFIVWHLSSGFESFKIIVNTCQCVTISTKKVEANLIVNEYQSEMTWKFMLVLSNKFPFELLAR